ncbi:MAG: SpoIID/LytB domain-containing protein, partial [Clostridiales bacterium]|nr:SpoIID/LytB domain-containing protein [Clostridiales bacterium]
GSAVGDAAVSLKLKSGEIAFIFDNPAYSLCIRPNPNLAAIQLTDRSYRGFVEVKTKNGKVSAVNVIPLEEYLYSVITSEMPKDWHAEALKAQAVSARSYTINRASKQPHGEGYDLCDDVHCQAYGGYGNESTEGRAAVDATRGICAYYNNEVIEAVFFSSSGGMTDDSENVWSNPQPYLRGVFDIAESEPLQWSRTFTSAELSALATAKGANIGSVTSVSIVKTGSTGRVLQLAVNGTIGSIVLSKEEVRTFFSTTKEGSLRSRNFVIANGISTIVPQNVAVINSYGITSATAANLYAIGAVETPQKLTSNSVQTVTSTGVSTVSLYSVTASASNETAFTFTGKGWGHGVGLNQHGAKAMAEAGYNFEQILKHYYTNIELAQYISQSDL